MDECSNCGENGIVEKSYCFQCKKQFCDDCLKICKECMQMLCIQHFNKHKCLY